MSQHTHMTCDGCDKEMELNEYGQLSGTLSLYGMGDVSKHFHGGRCLAKYAEKVNNALIGAPKIRVTVEDLGG